MSQRTLPSELVNEEKTFSVLEDSLRRSKRVALLVVFLSWMVSGSILAFVQPGPSVSTFALWAGRLLAFFPARIWRDVVGGLLSRRKLETLAALESFARVARKHCLALS